VFGEEAFLRENAKLRSGIERNFRVARDPTETRKLANQHCIAIDGKTGEPALIVNDLCRRIA
jgi:hypothetical protein